VERAQTAAASTRAVPGLRSLVALGVVVLAAATLLFRLPGALSDLNAQADRNNAYGPVGRTLAAADSVDIDNAFTVAALQLVPDSASFTVALPPADAKTTLSPLTIQAVPGYLRYTLLPRHEVAAADAEYLLCYECGRPPADAPRVRWLWHGSDGLRIGRILR
jgi:hypothetical protein